jgi:cellulose biosynthesis protein BcsQ
MIRIKLVILDSDANYISRLTNAFNANFSDRLEVYAFTKIKTFLDFIENNKVDVVLASESFGVETKALPETTEFAYFVDSSSIETLNNKKAICKYTKIDVIYKSILNLYSESQANVIGFKQEEDAKTKMLSFFPCSGGEGASVMAAAFCLNLAAKGKKVLYLNLEQFGIPGVFFNAEGSLGLSDLIYAIKSNKSNIVLKLESSVKEDKSGVYFFGECSVPLDLMEMTNEDIKKMLDITRNSGLFDYIVIDTDMTMNSITKQAMLNSQKIIFVSDGSQVSNLKFARIHKTLAIIETQLRVSLLSKLSVIYNKFNSNSSKYIDEIPNINSIGTVGEFGKASSLVIARQISQMQLFDIFDNNI